MIPVMFGPYEDELMESWTVRLAKANGMPVNYFRNVYLGDHIDIRGRTQSVTPYYLSGLFWKARTVLGFPEADRLLLFHTLLPFYQQTGDTVMSTARKVQAVLYDCGLEGYDVGYVHEPPPRRVCPQCLNGDAKRGILPYLRVWQQVPGARVCAVHRCPLLTVGKDYDLSAACREETDAASEADVMSAEKIQAMYLRIRTMKDFVPVGEGTAGGLVPGTGDRVFLYASCTSCGTRFLTTVYAVSKGRWCPVCDRTANVINRQIRMIPGYTPIRKIRSLADTGVVRHSCGQVPPWRAGDILWNGRRCGCGKKWN